ncbi:MAG: GMC family oxidoreductase N-terminal domain-containing protein [Chloroflexi bacterium]|nr:GMC family oxidoreductase N-terminal domain-containing protein [Chloroflexota bacterium]
MAETQPQDFPAYADTVVVGGGTAGATLAGRLAEGTDHSVLLLEAGPDYGPYAGGAWPPVLLDAREMAVSTHSWNYESAATHGKPGLLLERARVLGGCSSHNGCAAVWGHRTDYDGWAALGNTGWDTTSLLPLFETVMQKMRVSIPAPEQLTPWHQACLEAAPGAGFPMRDNLNDVDLTHGITINPVNIVPNGVRWNSAFAYLDPVRDRATLTIRGGVLADRLLVEGGRAVGVQAIGPDGPVAIRAGRVVLCAGAYGSPLTMLRSGIGAPDELRELGITPVHELPGVGRNLQDHALIPLLYAGTPELAESMARFEAEGGLMREEGTTIVARSGQCQGVFDLHIYPISSRVADSWARDLHRREGPAGWLFGIGSALLTPRSHGTVRLSSPGPEAAPRIDHAYFTDQDDRDVAALVDGIELSRQIAAQEPVKSLIGTEDEPGLSVTDRDELARYVRANSAHAYHPVGTCKMGPATDPSAVVDARGKVHGMDGLYVADAAIIPVIPRANTNIPVAVIAEKIAALLAR